MAAVKVVPQVQVQALAGRHAGLGELVEAALS